MESKIWYEETDWSYRIVEETYVAQKFHKITSTSVYFNGTNWVLQMTDSITSFVDVA